MHHLWKQVIVSLCGCLTLSVAAAQQTPAQPAQASTRQGSAQATQATPRTCLSEVFSGPLPGRANYCLGMRDWDEGHFQDGLRYLKLAAGWGNKSAQYTLGLIYYGGHHVPTNVALGLAWLKLADERQIDPQISLIRRSAFKTATTTQRERARALYGEMIGTYGDKVAAARAWHHLRHWKRSHDRLDSGCVRVSGKEAAAARRLGLAGQPPQAIERMLRPTGPISVKVLSGGGGAAASARAAQIEMKSHKLAREKRVRYSNAASGTCITIQMQRHVTRQLSDHYFAGTVWAGTVTVGPLLPASPATSGH